MNKPIRFTTTLALLAIFAASPSVEAQTVDLRFSTTINVGAGSGGVDQLEVVVEADTDVDFKVGNSAFRFFYNEPALDIPSGVNGGNQNLVEGTDYEWEPDFTQGAFPAPPYYNDNTVNTQGQLNRISANLVLTVVDFGSTLSASSGWVPLVRVFFDIADDQSTEMLVWVDPSDSDPSQIFLDDNVTAVTIGMMIDSDLPLDASAAVEFAGLQSTVNDGALSLNWSTVSESGNAGFAIEVTAADEAAWQEVGFVPGSGTSNEIRTYSYDVMGLDYGTWRVRLKQVDVHGSYTYSPEIEVAIELTGAFVLGDVYPSPFSSTARFTLAVGEPQAVTIDAYNLLGQKVFTIFEGDMAAHQTRSFELDGTSLSNGIYLIRAAGASFATTTSVALVK